MFRSFAAAGRSALFGACTLLAVGIGPSASAEMASDCPTWFPDFRCERNGRFEGFEAPIVQFALFEDPFITTGLQAYAMWHEFPETGAFKGGKLYDVSLQARVALTDRLALIATKDGYVWNRPDNDALPDTEGYLNIGGGLKYALFMSEERRYIVSPILRFEVPTGSEDTFSGEGDGMVIPSISAAWGPGKWLLMGQFGGEIPFDGNEETSSIFYQAYAGYDLNKHFKPFVQVSGITWLNPGDGKLPVNTRKRAGFPGNQVTLNAAQDVTNSGRFEGADVLNLGSRGVTNQTVVTGAVGAHVPLTERLTFGFAWERPLTTRKGIFKQRVTTSLAFTF